MEAPPPHLLVYSHLSVSLIMSSSFCVFLTKVIKYPSVFFSTMFIVLRSLVVVLFLHLAFNPLETFLCVGSNLFHRFKMKEMSSVCSLTYPPGLGGHWDHPVTGLLSNGSLQGRAGCAGEQPL